MAWLIFHYLSTNSGLLGYSSTTCYIWVNFLVIIIWLLSVFIYSRLILQKKCANFRSFLKYIRYAFFWCHAMFVCVWISSSISKSSRLFHLAILLTSYLLCFIWTICFFYQHHCFCYYFFFVSNDLHNKYIWEVLKELPSWATSS